MNHINDLVKLSKKYDVSLKELMKLYSIKTRKFYLKAFTENSEPHLNKEDNLAYNSLKREIINEYEKKELLKFKNLN